MVEAPVVLHLAAKLEFVASTIATMVDSPHPFLVCVVVSLALLDLAQGRTTLKTGVMAFGFLCFNGSLIVSFMFCLFDKISDFSQSIIPRTVLWSRSGCFGFVFF